VSDEQKKPALTRQISRNGLREVSKLPAPLVRVDVGAPDGVTIYLIAPGMPPLPLGGLRLSIGRHSECDLILPHVSVSRRHAVIKSRGKVTVLEDGGSRNGSFVNGKRVKKNQVLKVGDKVTLGPYTFEIRGARPRTNRLPALVGRIEDTPLLEVIQGIDFHRKTCLLRVESRGIKGRLSVRAGQPISARWGALENEQAVLQMLALSEGTFALSTDEPTTRESAFTMPLKKLLRR
jgi:pSer/pThr/pTyr-binding forkhead associated (FHA) protein